MDMQANSHTTLIINPVSGTRGKESIPDTVASVLRQDGAPEPEVLFTRQAGDGGMFAAEAVAHGSRLIVVAGGDGTVSDVAAALRGTPAALGIIPCGSGNGLARALGIPSDFEAAARLLGAEGKTMVCDNGLIDGRPFFCACGVGFDAEVSKSFAAGRRRGRLSYLKDALLEYISYSPQPYAISVGGRVITQEAFLIAVCNASQYGNNAYIAPHASVRDGLMDICILKRPAFFEILWFLLFFINSKLYKLSYYKEIQCEEAIVEGDIERVHIDGDAYIMHSPIHLKMHKGILKVVVPKKID